MSQPEHHRPTGIHMTEARRVIKKLRESSKSGKVAVFVVAKQGSEGFRAMLCDVRDGNPAWESAKKCALRMKRLAGVYTERAHLEWIADDLHALGLS